MDYLHRHHILLSIFPKEVTLLIDEYLLCCPIASIPRLDAQLEGWIKIYKDGQEKTRLIKKYANPVYFNKRYHTRNEAAYDLAKHFKKLGFQYVTVENNHVYFAPYFQTSKQNLRQSSDIVEHVFESLKQKFFTSTYEYDPDVLGNPHYKMTVKELGNKKMKIST